MSQHVRQFNQHPEPTDSHYSGDDLKLLLFEIAIYIILICAVVASIASPTMHVS